MSVIVDLQGFKSESNKFIPKEIAILYEERVQVFLIKPPFAYCMLTESEKKQVDWIQRNRNIFWNEGNIPYHNYEQYIIPYLENKVIFVKGEEKVTWLEEMTGFKNIWNLEKDGCPNLNELNSKYTKDVFKCLCHSSVCALKNVFLLYKWCQGNKNI